MFREAFSRLWRIIAVLPGDSLTNLTKAVDEHRKEIESLVPLVVRAGDLNRYADAVMKWAAFEREVDVTLWMVIGAGEIVGACVTDQIQSVRNKLLVIENILAECGIDKSDISRLEIP